MLYFTSGVPKSARKAVNSDFYKASLQNCSRHSGDAYLKDETPLKLFEEAVARGVDILAITDNRTDKAFDELHNKLPGEGYDVELADDMRTLVVSNNDEIILRILRGIEHFDTEAGHLVSFGYEKRMDYNPENDNFIRKNITSNRGGLIYLPHPANRKIGGIGLERLRTNFMGLLDSGVALDLNAQELSGHPLIRRITRKPGNNSDVYFFARKYEKPLIATPDSHRAQDVDRAYTLFRKDFFKGKSITEGIKSALEASVTGNYLTAVKTHVSYSIPGTLDWLLVKRLKSKEGRQQLITLAKELTGIIKRQE